MPNPENADNRLIRQSRDLVKPIVHKIARRALPIVERASGTKYVRERHVVQPKPKRSSDSTAKKTASETAKAYRNLADRLPGPKAQDIDGQITAPLKSETEAKFREVSRLKAQASLLRALTDGQSSLPVAVVSSGRALLDAGMYTECVSVGLTFAENPGNEQCGRALLGMAYNRASRAEIAWQQFEGLNDRNLIVASAEDYYPNAIEVLGQQSIALIEHARDLGEVEQWNSKAVLRTAEALFCNDSLELTGTIIRERLDADPADLTEKIRYELTRILDWLPGGSRLQSLSAGDKRNFGILSYDQPGTRSRNIGDYIQTVASLGHLLSYDNLSFTGDLALTELLSELKETVKPERRYEAPKAELNVVEVYRDGNVYQGIPEDTWYIAFGWYMHDTFGKTFNIPFHPNLRPILLSVFVRYPEMLSDDAIAYLKKYGPVGCRDWQSVALLRAVGVPAFFSGCITTTIDTLFPDAEQDKRDGTVRIDWAGGGRGPSKKQTVTAIRDYSFDDNLRLARNWVSDYAYRYAKVLTSRLHANLPARSVGAEVEFVPKNKSDSRFGGLYGIDDVAFERIRVGIREKLAVIIPLVASGESEDMIYRKWRELTADDMAFADEYLAHSHLPDVGPEGLRSVTELIDLPKTEEGTTEVFMTVRSDESDLVIACAQSIDKHISGRYRIWLAANSVPEEVVVAGNERLDRGEINVLPEVSFPGVENEQDLISALLPELFQEHRRLITIPASAEVMDDLSELLASHTGESLVSAKTDVRRSRTSGLTVMRRLASAFKDDYAEALQFVFASHAVVDKDFIPFDPQVAVFDLEKMRQSETASRILGLLSTYRHIGFVDAMQVAVGGDYQVIENDWNVQVQWEASDTAKLVNWRHQLHRRGGRAVGSRSA